MNTTHARRRLDMITDMEAHPDAEIGAAVPALLQDSDAAVGKVDPGATTPGSRVHVCPECGHPYPGGFQHNDQCWDCFQDLREARRAEEP